TKRNLCLAGTARSLFRPTKTYRGIRLIDKDKFRGRRVEPMRGRSLGGVLSRTDEETYSGDAFIADEMMNAKDVGVVEAP
ncbi:unnamed protein product, partial [marine sediment metagenome]